MKTKNIFIVLLVVFVLASCTSPSKAIPTETPISTSTILPTVSPTPTVTPTPTPIPTLTPTSTPQPAWVTNIAEPILAAIEGREPDFQDDFSSPYGGWKKADWCADGRLKFAEGEMVISDCQVSPDMGYTDFVIEMDARFLPGSSADPENRWRFQYRQNGNYNYFFDFHYSGNVVVGFEKLSSPGMYTDLPGVLLPGENTNHVLIIVKDQALALYVNDSPVYNSVLEPLQKNGGMVWSQGDTVAFDNFKIWDISDIPLEATPTP